MDRPFCRMAALLLAAMLLMGAAGPDTEPVFFFMLFPQEAAGEAATPGEAICL